LAVGFGVLTAALVLYAGARETSVFAVRDVSVESVPPAQARIVGEALVGLEGRSLLEVDQDEIQRRLDRLPHVHLLGYDRAFPNDLRVQVSVERAVAVLRRGSDRWLVSAQGRVLRPLEQPLRRPLPVVWLRRTVEPEVGAILRASEPARAVRAAAAVRAAGRLGRRVWYVKVGETGLLTAVLHDHFEIRLGTSAELPLKLAVARHVLARLRREGAAAAYLDVSVPTRAVVGETLESQLEPESIAADSPLTGG
jgi:cell division septal protein FtsQ